MIRSSVTTRTPTVADLPEYTTDSGDVGLGAVHGAYVRIDDGTGWLQHYTNSTGLGYDITNQVLIPHFEQPLKGWWVRAVLTDSFGSSSFALFSGIGSEPGFTSTPAENTWYKLGSSDGQITGPIFGMSTNQPGLHVKEIRLDFSRTGPQQGFAVDFFVFSYLEIMLIFPE